MNAPTNNIERTERMPRKSLYQRLGEIAAQYDLRVRELVPTTEEAQEAPDHANEQRGMGAEYQRSANALHYALLTQGQHTGRLMGALRHEVPALRQRRRTFLRDLAETACERTVDLDAHRMPALIGRVNALDAVIADLDWAIHAYAEVEQAEYGKAA